MKFLECYPNSMKKNLIVCGCSFTEGHFLKEKGSWATYFGNIHNMNVINLASGGAGNEFITTAPIHYSLANPEIAKDSLFIIQLSEITRVWMDWCDMSGLYIGTNVSTQNILQVPNWPTADARQLAFQTWLENSGEHIWPLYNNINHLYWKTLSGIVNFINFCDAHGYPYRIFDGLSTCVPQEIHPGVWRVRYPNPSDLDVREDNPSANKLYWIFLTRSLGTFLNNNPFYFKEKTLMEFVTEDDSRHILNDGHPNELGAKLWAEHLTEIFTLNS